MLICLYVGIFIRLLFFFVIISRLIGYFGCENIKLFVLGFIFIGVELKVRINV